LAALLPPSAFCQPYQPGKGPGAESAPSAQLSPQQKLSRYRHDQINLLALRADAPSLVAAALLARPDAKDSARPAVLKTPALLERAQRLDPDNALVWWVTAGVECSAPGAGACPSAGTLQKLERLDPGNAAVWALSLWRAQHEGNAPIARAALTSAAQAKHYDDYFGRLVTALYGAQAVLPMSSDLLLATGEQANVAGYRLTRAAAVAVAAIPPANKAVATACQAATAQRRADCVAVAGAMSTSGSLITRRDGIGLLQSLLQPGPRLNAARARARVLAWQMQQIGKLGNRLADDTRVSDVYLKALQASAAEVDAVEAVLRSQGVALHPPSTWQRGNAAR